MSKQIEMIEKRFGSLLVVSAAGPNRWTCKCDCGQEKIIRGDNLRSGRSKSCGNCDGSDPVLTPEEVAEHERREAKKAVETHDLWPESEWWYGCLHAGHLGTEEELIDFCHQKAYPPSKTFFSRIPGYPGTIEECRAAWIAKHGFDTEWDVKV